MNTNKILLLDYDHTLYPSTLPTLQAVDDRINLYIRTFLGLGEEEANATRTRLFMRHGTTLKGLEAAYGVDREHYCDFIHAVDDDHLPPPDPALQAWLARVAHPLYLFTNARPYAKVDAHLRARHGQDIQIHFADDRIDNLEAARDRGWRTIWIVPHNASPDLGAAFDRTLPSLTGLDPLGLL